MNLLFWLSFMLGCSYDAAQIRGKSSTWLSKKLVETTNPSLQLLLIKEMEQRKDPAHLVQLVRFAGDSNKSISKAAFSALLSYDGRFEERDAFYLQMLDGPNLQYQRMATRGISDRFLAQEQVPYLKNSLMKKSKQSRSWTVRLHAIQVLTWVAGEDIDLLLMERARIDQNAEVRRAAVMAIGGRQIEPAKQLLHEIRSKDMEPTVRLAAEEALRKIGGKRTDLVIAVMPFDCNVTDYSNLIGGFQSYLSGRLSAAKIATVVERGQVNTVIDELIYQDTFIDDGNAVEIGKALRASQVVTGSVQVFQGSVVITIKRIDVTTQEILSSSQTSGEILDFNSLQQKSAQSFIDAF